jgi:hypothetical protein
MGPIKRLRVLGLLTHGWSDGEIATFRGVARSRNRMVGHLGEDFTQGKCISDPLAGLMEYLDRRQ